MPHAMKPSIHTTFRLLLFFIATICNISHSGNLLHAQTMRGQMLNYLDNYTRKDQYIKSSRLDSIVTDTLREEIRMYVSGGFKEQFFTSETVDDIYKSVKAFVPDSLSHYHLGIFTDSHPIEQLVPNALRKGKLSAERLAGKEFNGVPWTTNTSSPLKITKGLNGRHLVVWQSHGNYFASDAGKWKWQRPRLFCTTEDLFTQTFVVPYIIPMLENAGATVYTPRERDWQNQEYIIDNDSSVNSTLSRGTYAEEGEWQTTELEGFALSRTEYRQGENPFRHGTARQTPSSRNGRPTSIITWAPAIEKEGRYAVYVSYQSLPTSIADAHYTVIHKGIRTNISVNQTMGGRTWVYLGTFLFGSGNPEANKVELTNESHSHGIVTADAVRFGGGMGNIRRSERSYLPRWAEAAVYSAQWAGFPDSVYNHYNGTNDYNSDLWVRPNVVNYLSGRSVFNPDSVGLNVPVELAMAFHSDAGFSQADELIGSLGICSTNYYGGVTASGQDRFASYDLASMFLSGLQHDMQKYDWQVRQLWNRNYCETREPQVPSTILEMLSHQNFADMRLGYDPHFKFDFCRSVYKTIVKYLATQHQTDYAIQPLPVHNFAIALDDEKHFAHLTWDATKDELEPTADPDEYIVYTRIDDGDFDNGTLLGNNSMKAQLIPGHIYSFQIRAANKGGVSFPSETLSAYISPANTGTVLIVNAFDRLEGPAWINDDAIQGFDLDADPGVQYGMFAGFCGRQVTFSKANMGSEATSGTGYSGSELEGNLIMGNTFDYTTLHGEGIRMTGTHSFTSCSAEALTSQSVNPDEYKMVDIIFGTDKQIDLKTTAIINNYVSRGGRLFISGNSCDVIAPIAKAVSVSQCNSIRSYELDGVNGSGISCSIHRQMNPDSYAVPSILTMQPTTQAFAMLQYSDNRPAAIAYDGNDHKTIAMGFPLESIKEKEARNLLMQAITTFLCR